MYRIRITKDILWRHIRNWLMITIVANILIPFTNISLWILCLWIPAEMLPYIFTYYAQALFINPYKFENKKKYALYSILNSIIYLIITYTVSYGFSYIGYDAAFKFPALYWFVNVLGSYFITFRLADSFYRNQFSIWQMQEMGQGEENILKQEILFFKNQFNDRISNQFLNYCKDTLNGQFSLGESAIQIYSEMLSSTKDLDSAITIPLDKEINYLEQYIQLQEIVSKKNFVKIEKQGKLEDFTILPRILITFVENAYKYGISNEAERPIKIKARVENNMLNFEVSNFIKTLNKSVDSTKTGNLNAKEQLELFYPNKYSILVSQDERQYLCKVLINLSK